MASLHVIPWSAITIPLIRLSLSEAPVVSYQLGVCGGHAQEHPRETASTDPPSRINPLPGFPPRGRSPVGLHADLAAVEVAGSEHTGRRLTQGVTAHLALTAETDLAHQVDPAAVQKIVKSSNEQLAGLGERRGRGRASAGLWLQAD